MSICIIYIYYQCIYIKLIIKLLLFFFSLNSSFFFLLPFVYYSLGCVCVCISVSSLLLPLFYFIGKRYIEVYSNILSLMPYKKKKNYTSCLSFCMYLFIYVLVRTHTDSFYFFLLFNCGNNTLLSPQEEVK